jgi:uncharacterized protein (DUF1684 family)
MCRIGLIMLVLLALGCQRKSDYENRVDHFRAQTIGFYTKPDETPLDSNELKTFKGIHYYAIDESFKLPATLLWLPQTAFISMPQSGGDVRPYMKVAEIHFELKGKTCTLFAYQTEKMKTEHVLFVPFTDPTNGTATYGGGRYLDLSYNPASSELDIDFNFAYAPFCAYTHHFSCPLVPTDNSLPVAITAGEKMN